MPHNEPAASHETSRASIAWLIAFKILVGGGVVLGLGIAAVFAYVILGGMLSFEAY